jgi:hypothetical protein
MFEESKPEEIQTALVETLRHIDENKVITNAFLVNGAEGAQADGRHYVLPTAVVDELVGTVGAFLTAEKEHDD